MKELGAVPTEYVAYLTRAVKSAPEWINPRIDLARALIALGRLDEAEAELTTALNTIATVNEAYPRVRELGQNVHRYGRDVRMLIAEQPEPDLIGDIDIWSPNLGYFHPAPAHDRQEHGEAIWWYTAIGPQAPFPTYLIDDAAISHRILSWLQVKYHIDGTLYWSTTVFKKWDQERQQYGPRDVWTDPEAFPRGYGDGFLLYPGTRYGIDGPIGTVRLEMIREGNEDLEYFWLYRRLAAQSGLSEEQIEARVQAFIAPIATGLQNWERDPAALYRQRQLLARAIRTLSERIDR